MSRRRRVFHAELAEAGAELTLDRAESRHLTRVLRLPVGEQVGVFDGRGDEWVAEIVAIERAEVRLRLQARCEDPVEAPLSITLFQALSRADRLESVIQKGTEIGVARFHLVETERSEGAPPNPARRERWSRIAREACKQSGRRLVPSIEGPSPLWVAVAEGAAGWVLDPGPGADPLVARLAGERPSALWLAVGPEGGFTPAELEASTAGGWARAGLGPRVLRTETAGIVAASLALGRWGDLGGPRR